MPFIVPVFQNNMAKYFDSESMLYAMGPMGPPGDVEGVMSPGTAHGWSESVAMASAAVFPPSVTIPAAQAAMFGQLQSWSHAADGNGAMLKAAIDLFYSVYALGCLPLFAAIPPVQCPIDSNFQFVLDGLSHSDWAQNCGNSISDWLKTATWIQTVSGAGGTWT